MMKLRKNFSVLKWIAIILVLTACGGERQAQPTATPEIQLVNCNLDAPNTSNRVAAKCGTFSVYENFKTRTGRIIELSVAVLPAVSRNSSPDPVFFLTGGPGQAATESFLQMDQYFSRINQNRDIVLVDQRGTGKSHALDCEVPSSEADSPDVLPQKFLKDCLETLDADPQWYTTEAAMTDLDMIRSTLGYQEINIYGVSYGTRAALTYLRMYPDRVRSLILDGVAPPQIHLGLHISRDAQRALDLIFARCAGEEDCSEKFPDLKGSFEDILMKLQDSPVDLRISHPISGEMVDIVFDAEMFSTAVRLLSYSPETVALLPLLIYTAVSEGDYSLLADQYLLAADSLSTSISSGMSYSVLCSEDVPFFTQPEANKENQGAYLGNVQTDTLFDICSVWPHEVAPPQFKDPVQSNVPVLILSGEFDPVTPPEYGDLAAETLPNSLHLIVPGQGHNVFLRGCVWRLATEFLDNLDFETLDLTCVDKITPLPFFVNFAGPQP